MIINTDKKFVWIDIPKCATTSLDDFFFNLGNTKRDRFKHCRVIPEFAKDFIKIHSVRNPYVWLVSHYNRTVRYRLNNGNFDNFLNNIISKLDYPDNERDGTIYQFYPAHKYVRPIGKIDYVIHVENIVEDLLKIPFITKYSINKLNVGNYNRNLSMYYTSQEILDKANFWAGEDFEKYGYEKITSISDMNKIF